MKNVLLAGTALVATALIASPAQAELKLDLGGHFSGYGVYVDQDNDTGFDDTAFRKNTEIHFTGETTLDNGLTVGVHVEQEIENNQDDNESYAYFSGGWGRVNFGNEDGAAYLLQVAAPSADSNVDGLRTTINATKTPGNAALADNLGAGIALAAAAPGSMALDYQHADFGNAPSDSGKNAPAARFTYLTPKFSGFQAGVSYAPRAERPTGIANLAQPVTGYENLWELAARWDGEFEGVGMSFGAGYSNASGYGTALPAAQPDDLTTWNVGANLSWNQFSFGGAYLDSDNGNDNKTWVVGAAWDNGPWHVGLSYLDTTADNGGLTYQYDAASLVPAESAIQTNDAEANRITLGGGYQFGPGMTFRGALSWGEYDYGSVTDPVGGTTVSAQEDFTQFTIGTDIQF